jgi:hypothetical protein
MTATAIWRDELDRLLVREPLTQRMAVMGMESKQFLPIWFGKPVPSLDNKAISVSIQASQHHYSTPRKTFPWPANYTDFEIYFPDATQLVMQDWAIWRELEQYGDGGGVFGYVPRDLISRVVDTLKQATMGPAYPVSHNDGSW